MSDSLSRFVTPFMSRFEDEEESGVYNDENEDDNDITDDDEENGSDDMKVKGMTRRKMMMVEL